MVENSTEYEISLHAQVSREAAWTTRQLENREVFAKFSPKLPYSVCPLVKMTGKF